MARNHKKPDHSPEDIKGIYEGIDGILDPQFSVEETRRREFSYGNEGRRASTEAKMYAWLNEYGANGYQIIAACESVGVTYSSFCHWKERYPDFAQAVDSFRVNLAHQALGVINKGLTGRLDISDAEKARLAIDLLRVFRGTEVNVTQNGEGKIEGISIRFVD